ncbi:MAG: SpoIIE family protein phosphatase, partial [Treponemataceae bacterium]|nr:SpoIIE family protein phosphatase [Treponemataceae bacterium]
MYRTRKKLAFLLIDIAVLLISVCLSIVLVSSNTVKNSVVIAAGTPAVIFMSFLIIGSAVRTSSNSYLYKKHLDSGCTKLFGDFIDRLKFCYSFEDLYDATAEILELKADCAVLFIDREKNYILYNSPDRISSYYSTRDKIARNFPISWKGGVYFLGNAFDVVGSSRKARGFLMCYENFQFYVFCRYMSMFDVDIYDKLYEEYVRFLSRTKIISNLSEISSLTKEWEQLAETQVSFLPRKMPDIPHLKIATYYRPLVNVSGDYYSILPISSAKTLLMLGDVSGKGLPAALIMGLVMNTVKIMENKEDLVGLVQGVDRAIKGMHLQDKYTVLFLGIVDTDRMRITYVNASMSDPIILSRSPDGYRIKSLASNASLVGIIDMDDVRVSEQRLFRGDTILLATDGVSEVMDDSGVELGDTDISKETLQT